MWDLMVVGVCLVVVVSALFGCIVRVNGRFYFPQRDERLRDALSDFFLSLFIFQ